MFIARAIAAKAALAARVDVFGAGRNAMLFEKLNVRIKEIGEKYKEPPERPAQVQQIRRPSEGENKWITLIQQATNDKK